jgi:hypothetical protein
MVIGFTGHQKIDHPERWGWVREQFAGILGKAAGRGDRVMSSLAEGGDQLFAETALGLGMAVEVVIPCDGYESTFDEPGERERYEEMLREAAAVTRLGFPSPSEDAYLAAGKHIVDQSMLVVALWNGKPAAGKGGTGDIVAYARERGRPVIHVHPDLMLVFGPDRGGEGEASWVPIR